MCVKRARRLRHISLPYISAWGSICVARPRGRLRQLLNQEHALLLCQFLTNLLYHQAVRPVAPSPRPPRLGPSPRLAVACPAPCPLPAASQRRPAPRLPPSALHTGQVNLDEELMAATLGTVLGALRRFCRGEEHSDEATFSALRALAAVIYDGGNHCIKVRRGGVCAETSARCRHGADPPPPLLPPQYCDQLIGPQGVLLSLASVSTPNLHVRRTAVQCIGYLCSGTMAAAKGDK